MRQRRGRAASALYSREEPVGLACREVDYEIHATVTRTDSIAYFHYPEACEVEVITVLRIDPDTSARGRIESRDWAFTDDEYQQITSLLASRFESEEPDDADPAEDK